MTKYLSVITAAALIGIITGPCIAGIAAIWSDFLGAKLGAVVLASSIGYSIAYGLIDRVSAGSADDTNGISWEANGYAHMNGLSVGGRQVIQYLSKWYPRANLKGNFTNNVVFYLVKDFN